MSDPAPAKIPHLYLCVTLGGPLLWLASVTAKLIPLTAEGGVYRKMLEDFGGKVPEITSHWLALARYTPLLVVPAVAAALYVVYRRSDSERWAIGVFLGIFGVSWVVFAWSLIAAYSPLFRIAQAMR